MGKIKKFTGLQVKKLTGGKDPVRLVEEFLVRQGYNAKDAKNIEEVDLIRWTIEVDKQQELEILVENLNMPNHSTIYMGVNVAVVPLKGVYDFLVSALEIADGMVGTKVSLVGHFLVLSSSFGSSGISVEDLEYNYKLIVAQLDWFRIALLEDLGWTEFPD